MEDLTLLYSEIILSFVAKLQKSIKQIFQKEMMLDVRGRCVIIKGYSYSISVVVFEHPRRLGYFQPELYEIGINKVLMLSTYKRYLHSVLRHELAHYITFLEYGSSVQDHGLEYRNVCRGYGWGKDIYAATISVDDDLSKPLPEIALMRKVRKLLALGTSNNKHEAEQAAIKSREILMKYNFENVNVDSITEYVVRRVLHAKRNSVKLDAISEILRTLFVQSIVNCGSSCVYLEVFGRHHNVEVANYVAKFLEREMEILWLQEKKKNPSLKGKTCKNSFFRGLAKGFCHKVQNQQMQYTDNTTRALTLIERDLEDKMPMAYPRLRRQSRKYRNCKKSADLGQSVGANMQIHKAVPSASKNSQKKLTFSSDFFF